MPQKSFTFEPYAFKSSSMPYLPTSQICGLCMYFCTLQGKSYFPSVVTEIFILIYNKATISDKMLWEYKKMYMKIPRLLLSPFPLKCCKPII